MLYGSSVQAAHLQKCNASIIVIKSADLAFLPVATFGHARMLAAVRTVTSHTKRRQGGLVWAQLNFPSFRMVGLGCFGSLGTVLAA